MLIKLLKYEMQATARLLLPLYVVLLAFAGISSLLLPGVYQQNIDIIRGIATFISMFIYVILMIGMLVMSLVIMIQRFYKNLLGDEGYLMFTLPIQTWAHILSKLLVAMFWFISSSIIAILSISIIAKTPIPFEEIFGKFKLFADQFGINSILFGLEICILGLFALAATIIMIYCAIALGHLFNKYQLLASFGMYIVINTTSQILFAILASITGNIFESTFTLPTSHTVDLIILLLILFIGFITASSFVLTQVLLKKKLNLE